MLSTALASIRKVLLSSPSNAKAALVTRSKVSAVKLLNVLLEDWKSSSAPQLPFITEVSSLVSRTVRVHFQDIIERQKDGHLPTKDDLQLSSLSGTLLSNAIIFPPTETGSDTAVLNELLDCIPLMNEVAKESSPFVKDDVILAHMVLRAIHTALYTPSDDETFQRIATAVNHSTLGGLFPSLSHLLQSAHLGDAATRLFSAMLSSGTDKSVDAVSACRLAKTLYEREITSAEAASELTSPRSGSKRRGRSSQASPYYAQQLPLRNERSPKRSRIGLATDTHPSLATPSPPSWQHSSGLVSNTGHSKASPSGNGSCNEVLGSILREGLLNAKHIGGTVDPCRALFQVAKASPINSMDSKDGTLKAVVSVSTAFRLLLGLISSECKEVADDEATALLEVACLLAKALKSVAFSLSSHCKKSKADLSDEACRSVKCVIRVGLEAQFTVGRLITYLPKVHQDAIADCLDAIAVCARDTWAMHLRDPVSTAEDTSDMLLDACEARECKAVFCDGTCCKLKKLLSCNDNDSRDWLPCLCKLLRLPGALDRHMATSSDLDHKYQCDCAMMLFERFSIQET